jgi:radical SAM protein with 4Fe4S-binding SPASM domain
MIVDDLTRIQEPATRPVLRVREEHTGGQSFDPKTGRIVSLNEEELARLRDQAAVDPRIIYYAARQWSQWSRMPLSEGCSASPVRVYLEITQGCNLLCPMCYRDAGAASPLELSPPELLRLIHSLSVIGVHELRITGGEPTTHPDLLDLIDAAVEAGLYVSLNTNGVWPDGLAGQLLTRPVGRYIVSLEGTAAVNDTLRGPGTYSHIIQTIDDLVAAGKPVRVNTMLAKTSLQHLPELVALCAAHQVRHMALIPPRPGGRAASAEFAAEFPGPAEMEKAARLIEPLGREYGVDIEYEFNIYQPNSSGQASDPVIHKLVSCSAGRESAFISPEGWLYACGCSPGGSPVPAERLPFAAGNIRYLSELELWRAWQTSAVWQPFRDLRHSKDPACFLCSYYGRGCFGSCPVHAFLTSGTFNGPDPLCWVRDSLIHHSTEASQ